jgi:undecaprenyl-diphosphatase
MNLVIAFILGALQGVTEWLPVSSSGHLVLAESIFGLSSSENLLFDLVVHVGTLLAVCAYFSKELGRIVLAMLTTKAKRDAQMDALRMLGFLILIATVPIAVVGVLLTSVIESIFSPGVVACALVVNGLMLFVYSKYGSSGTRRNARLKDAVVVGLFQAISIIPGISRSGSTIGGGMMMGLEREMAAVFAFLVSVPALLGAFVYGLVTLNSYNLYLAAGLTGFFVAFATGLVSIQYLLKMVKTGRLWVFGVYCVIAGLVGLASML